MAYIVVSTASDVNSPYKNPVVTSDNCQVTLRVTRKRAVHIINIIKANVKLSTSIISCRCTAVHAFGQLPQSSMTRCCKNWQNLMTYN